MPLSCPKVVAGYFNKNCFQSFLLGDEVREKLIFLYVFIATEYESDEGHSPVSFMRFLPHVYELVITAESESNFVCQSGEIHFWCGFKNFHAGYRRQRRFIRSAFVWNFCRNKVVPHQKLKHDEPN